MMMNRFFLAFKVNTFVFRFLFFPKKENERNSAAATEQNLHLNFKKKVGFTVKNHDEIFIIGI